MRYVIGVDLGTSGTKTALFVLSESDSFLINYNTFIFFMLHNVSRET